MGDRSQDFSDDYPGPSAHHRGNGSYPIGPSYFQPSLAARSTYPTASGTGARYEHHQAEQEDDNAEAGPSTLAPSFDMPYRPPSPVQIPPLAIDIDMEHTSHSHYGAYGSTSNLRGEPPSKRAHLARTEDRGQGSLWRSGEQGGGPLLLPPHPAPMNGRTKRDAGPNGWLNEYPGHAISREVEQVCPSPPAAGGAKGQLQDYLHELTSIMRPFAKSPENPSPEKPPSHLHARFIRLSSLVGDSLNRISPHVSPYLSPDFTIPPPTRATEMTAAEKEMEIIRKRRDVLIAKAAQLANSDRTASYASQYVAGHAGYPQGPWSPHAGEVPRAPGGYHPMGERDPELPTPNDPPAHWGGTCHSCGVGLAGEGATGPDGPMSLCTLCGSHYARLSMRRTQSSEGRFAHSAPATATALA